MPLLLAHAARGDLPDVVALFERTRARLAERGIDQWSEGVPASTFRRDVVARTLFVARGANGIEAMATLQREDDEVWGARSGAEPAVYLHRLLAVPERRGLGAAVIDWLARYAARCGATAMRLDCAAENSALCRFYRANAFADAGVAVVRSPSGRSMPVRRFERPLLH